MEHWVRRPDARRPETQRVDDDDFRCVSRQGSRERSLLRRVADRIRRSKRPSDRPFVDRLLRRAPSSARTYRPPRRQARLNIAGGPDGRGRSLAWRCDGPAVATTDRSYVRRRKRQTSPSPAIVAAGRLGLTCALPGSWVCRGSPRLDHCASDCVRVASWPSGGLVGKVPDGTGVDRR
jgi:hypothetical protein